jgi:hypothetical protein
MLASYLGSKVRVAAGGGGDLVSPRTVFSTDAIVAVAIALS